MKSTTALDEFQRIIQQHSANTSFCEGELRWIENRKSDWDSNRIRVGVIGVTSSGKSTLINAILGTDILSSAVAPSSGQLVCCSYGEKPEIIIRFEDGTSQILSGENFSQELLKQYSDERYNPQNEKGVLSIELTSPLFDFGKDVLLVDSPGLDAFGLESHERLTLESLVPTIDACIYVTTMKASDRKTLEILNTVAKYHCPIIIVQNMLDSVRPSLSGDKSSEQVAADYKDRVRETVDKSSIEDKNSVRIIQISAEFAKRWRTACAAGVEPPISSELYQKSNYELFVESVTSIIEGQKPRIERQRLSSIQSCASRLEETIQNTVNKPATPVEKSFPLQALKERTEARKKSVESEYTSIIASYLSAAQKIKVAIGVEKETSPRNKKTDTLMQSMMSTLENFISLSRSITSHQSLEDSLKATNEAVKAFEDALADLIASHNAFVISAAQEINIPSRDLLCSSSLHSFRAVPLEKKTETKSRKVKKSGVFSGLARGAGKFLEAITGGRAGSDLGYEYESYEVVVTDPEATKKKICARLEDAYSRYTKSMEDWEEKNFNPSMKRIEDEIQASEENYSRMKDTAVEIESLSRLGGDLKVFIEQIAESLPSSQFAEYNENKEPVFSLNKVDATPYTSAILELSRAALQKQHRAIARSFVSAIGCTRHTPIVISWDDACANEFMWQTGISDAISIRSPVSDSAIPKERNRCLFVLVNAIQYGAALKQVSSLKLNSLLTKQDHVVWVVQDFQELLTGDRTAEGLSQMTEFSAVLQIPCKSSIYIMHQNPIYNLAFLKQQFNHSLRHTPHKLINELQENFGGYLSPAVTDTLGEIINSVHLR